MNKKHIKQIRRDCCGAMQHSSLRIPLLWRPRICVHIEKGVARNTYSVAPLSFATLSESADSCAIRGIICSPDWTHVDPCLRSSHLDLTRTRMLTKLVVALQLVPARS